MSEVSLLEQTFKFTPYEYYGFNFIKRDWWCKQKNYIQVNIRTWSKYYECFIDMDSAEVVDAHREKMTDDRGTEIEECNHLLGVCGYTKDKMKTIIKFIYELGDFNCQPYLGGQNHKDSVEAQYV